ncbi:MAG TPA: MurT ligase domain-containing protein, partial [Candidatus Dormibacteraeota bacterium]
MRTRRDARLGAAVLAGKLAATASRGLGRGGGTTIPGDVALAIDPGVLAKLGATLPRGSVLVTGTNGKTTTTGLIAAVLEAAGERVLTNASGANLVFGLVAAAVAQARPLGGARTDRAVFEVDELSLERAVIELRPRLVVVLNLLRDQLDRSGELATTARRIGEGLRRLPPGAQIVANADDPLVVAQCEGLPGVVYVGIDADDQLLDGVPHAADARTGPRCGAPLRFDRVVLAHCGSYRCTRCDFARPRPAVAVRRIAATGLDSQRLELDDGTELCAAVGGVYNAYNLVAAHAAATSLGVAPATVAAAVSGFRPRFGRMERLRLHGRELRFLLAKNPAGLDVVLRTADELGHARTYLIAINDLVADGRDVSWLWDVDFERLALSPRRPHVVASGRRAHDLAVRLKYAGLPAEQVTVEPDPAAALRLV